VSAGIYQHPDLPGEQALLDRAYACLGRMRRRADDLKGLGYMGGNVTEGGVTPHDVQQWERDRQERVDQLADPATALCFGRIDTGPPGPNGEDEVGERWYIGRRHVEAEDGEALIADWRAPVAVPFYRATVADTMGLSLRRRFLIEGRQLVDIFDEDLAHPSSVDAGAYVPDPLLAEITRSRTGEMRDIVATIAAEQDVIIRAPIETCVIVQGGPGTGKTAVGLHRAAFLLYEHRAQLERERVLIVGPNRIFLRYIAQVLPSLGEEASIQVTIEGLAGVRYQIGEIDPPAVARLKGDRRMAAVVRKAVFDRVVPPTADVRIRTSFGPVILKAEETAAVVSNAQVRSRRLSDGRNLVREQLVRLAWATHVARQTADVTKQHLFESDVRSSDEFKSLVDKAWPTVTAAGALRRLYGNRPALARAAEGLLSADEAASLNRPVPAKASQQRWTRADLPLLDEAEFLISGVRQTYGHVVVDEAQDLSAMEFRMVARRSPRRSLTVLGDLAQATAPGAQSDWSDAIGNLEAKGARVEQLTVGYRVPEPIMAFANQLLPAIAVDLHPPRSVRQAGVPPVLKRTDPGELGRFTAQEAAEVGAQWTLTAIVAPGALISEVGDALSAAGVAFVDGTSAWALGDHITLLPPAATKGLEFDAVVVVEPTRIVLEAGGDLRLLYVVLTRAVQHLSVIHSDPLPHVLNGLADESETTDPRLGVDRLGALGLVRPAG
jgi:DNA helicase IV